jgi:hypothetical protein
MAHARVSFGACVSQDAKYIYIAGGAEGEAKKPTNYVERYNIDTDEWVELPPLNQPRFSCSIIQNGNLLFAFGGEDTDASGAHFALKSIEVLDLSEEGASWETLSAKLPFKACSAGAITLGPNQILIFGGWAKNVLSESCMLRRASDGDFEVGEADPLQDGDTFLSLGARYRNEAEREIIVFGVQNTHLFNEVEQNWLTL